MRNVRSAIVFLVLAGLLGVVPVGADQLPEALEPPAVLAGAETGVNPERRGQTPFPAAARVDSTTRRSIQDNG
jgi:hypothetical protein